MGVTSIRHQRVYVHEHLLTSCHHGDSFFLEKLLTILSDDQEKLTNMHANSLLFNNKKLMISSFGNMYELHNFNLPSVFLTFSNDICRKRCRYQINVNELVFQA